MITERRKLTKAERLGVYEKCDSRCAYCGDSLEYKAMQVDHVHPLRKGGADEMDNWMPACRSCNIYKSTLTVEQFRKCIEDIHKKLMRDSATYRHGIRFGVIKECVPEVVFHFEKQSNNN
jgi:5-methylcytosine-specific restriction endonuclease McrA